MVAAAFRSISALTNPLEIEARWDEVTDLVDGHGFTKAAGAVLADEHDEWAIASRHLSEASMDQLEQTRNTDPSPPRTRGVTTPSITHRNPTTPLRRRLLDRPSTTKRCLDDKLRGLEDFCAHVSR